MFNILHEKKNCLRLLTLFAIVWLTSLQALMNIDKKKTNICYIPKDSQGFATQWDITLLKMTLVIILNKSTSLAMSIKEEYDYLRIGRATVAFISTPAKCPRVWKEIGDSECQLPRESCHSKALPSVTHPHIQTTATSPYCLIRRPARRGHGVSGTLGMLSHSNIDIYFFICIRSQRTSVGAVKMESKRWR